MLFPKRVRILASSLGLAVASILGLAATVLASSMPGPFPM
jgi:hypothetical protein